jgi:hypothetical protein
MDPQRAETDADNLVHLYESETQELIQAAREVLREAFPDVRETADVKARLLGYSYGPGYKGTVATLILSKSGVKIGIPFGASLADPAHLLAGAGKVHRHVAITKPAELRKPALEALLKQALRAWRDRTGAVSNSGR